MADISKLLQLASGKTPRTVDISDNTLVTTSVKVGGGVSNTELTKAILDGLISSASAADSHILNTSNPHSVTKSQILTGNLIVNADVDASAAIAESKLNLAYSTSSLNSAISGKEPTIASGTTSQYWRGDKSWQTLDSAAVGLGNVTNDAQVKKAVSSVDGNFMSFSGTSGDQAADSGYSAASFATAAHNHSGVYEPANANIQSHISSTSNPHSVTKSQILTGNLIVNADVDNAAAIAESKLNLAYSTSSLNTAINNLSSLIQNFEWQESVVDKLATPPGSPATGARYLVIATATGDWAGKEDQIAEWNGSAWVFTTPTIGTYLSVDDENDGLYLYTGSDWTKKYFEATTASTGLEKVGFDIRLANAAAANGISVSSGAISAVVDNSSIEINGSAQLQVKALGITNAMLAGSIATSKLSDSANFLLSNASHALTDAVRYTYAVDQTFANAGDLVTKKYVDDAVAAKDAASEISYSNATSGLAATTVQAAIDEVEGRLDSAESAISSMTLNKIVKSFVAGESFSANTSYMVRFAMTGETAGRVYKADYDATSSDNFYAVGFIEGNAAAAKSAGDSVNVYLLGEITLGSSDAAFDAGEVGQAVHLKAAGAFDAVSQVDYSSSNLASYRGGMVVDTNKILVCNMQLLGIS